MSDLTRVYRKLLENPADVEIMQVLADLLEESGHTDMANTYRWAARNKRWPFVRKEWFRLEEKGRRKVDHQRDIYDWDRVERQVSPNYQAPEPSRLPVELWRWIGNSPREGKNNYGGPHRAFKLLARALKANPEYLKEGLV